MTQFRPRHSQDEIAETEMSEHCSPDIYLSVLRGVHCVDGTSQQKSKHEGYYAKDIATGGNKEKLVGDVLTTYTGNREASCETTDRGLTNHD